MGRPSKTFSLEQVESAKKKLKKIPDKPKSEHKLSTQIALSSLTPEITELKSKGYSFDEILVILRDSGIEIGKTSLKTALKDQKPAVKRPLNGTKTAQTASAYTHNPDDK